MRKLLKNRNFVKLILSNSIGRFADSLDAITFSWLMYLISDNAVLIALIFAVNYIPNIVMMPFTGVLADRISKKHMVFFCDCGRFLLPVLTFVLLQLQILQPWMLFFLTFFVSTLESFRIPASSAMLPEVLEMEQIKAGNGLNLALRRIFEAIGTASAGILIAGFGCPIVLVVEGSLFLCSGIVSLTITKANEPLTAVPERSNFFSDFRAGLHVLGGNHTIMDLIVLTAGFNFLSVPYSALQAVFFGDMLGFSTKALSYCSSALLVAMSLSAVLIAKQQNQLKKYGEKTLSLLSLSWFFPFYLCLSLCTNILPDMVRFSLVFLLYSVTGITSAIFSVLVGSAMMKTVDPSMLGRISGISSAIGVVMVPLSSLLCSALSGIFDVAGVYLCFSAASILFLFAWRVAHGTKGNQT
ncbi:MAG: MFS transporter [Butyricicoccus sp.]